MKPDEDSMEDRVTLPILPIRGFFAYPGQSINFDVNRLGSFACIGKGCKGRNRDSFGRAERCNAGEAWQRGLA